MSESGSEQYDDEMRSRMVHVIYCPECRREVGRYTEVDHAADAAAIHHTQTGHDAGLVSGVYRDD